MTEFKFPHTPHLAWLGPRAPRADKVLTPAEAQRFLSLPVVVEEKVDGANIGISFEGGETPVVKNRGTVLGPGSHPQFQRLWPWLAKHGDVLCHALGAELMLFGEWCFAVHTVRYSDLPDYFVGFDVYDVNAKRFWSAARRDAWAVPLGIITVPVVARGTLSLTDLEGLLLSLRSRFGGEAAEGIYVRQDGNDWLNGRAKLVRPEFLQAIQEHWMNHRLKKNLLVGAMA